VNHSLKSNPENILLLQLKGEVLCNFKRFKEALEVFEAGLHIEPESLSFWKGKAVTLANMGELAEALTCLEHTLNRSEYDSHAWFSKGMIHMQLKEFNSALECFDKALKIDPHNQEIINKKSLALRLAKAPSKDIVMKALKIFDEGVLMAKRRNYDEAIRLFTECIKIYPGFGEHYLERGNVYIKQGKYENALKDFEEVLKIDPYAESAKRQADLCRMMSKAPGLQSVWGDIMGKIDDFKAEQEAKFGPNFNPNDWNIYLPRYKQHFTRIYTLLYEVLSSLTDTEWISIRINRGSFEGLLEEDFLCQHDFEFKLSDLKRNLPEILYRIYTTSGYFILYAGKLFSSKNRFFILIGTDMDLTDKNLVLIPSERGIKEYPFHPDIRDRYGEIKSKWKAIWEGIVLPPMDYLAHPEVFLNFITSIPIPESNITSPPIKPPLLNPNTFVDLKKLLGPMTRRFCTQCKQFRSEAEGVNCRICGTILITRDL